jgi:hypothetical protein
MSKDFFKMTPGERDAEAKKLDREISFDQTRPLSKQSKAIWESAKRGRGRPRKPAGEKAERILISIEPQLLALVEGFASSNGLDRSKLFALSVQAFIAADHAHRQLAKPTPMAATHTNTGAKKDVKDIKHVWIEYKKHKTESLRNILMENYLHLVRYNAERIHVKLPDEAELDDLLSAGIFGLMDAINAFDMERGVKFETYCAPHIRSAILGELHSSRFGAASRAIAPAQGGRPTKRAKVQLGRPH